MKPLDEIRNDIIRLMSYSGDTYLLTLDARRLFSNLGIYINKWKEQDERIYAIAKYHPTLLQAVYYLQEEIAQMGIVIIHIGEEYNIFATEFERRLFFRFRPEDEEYNTIVSLSEHSKKEAILNSDHQDHIVKAMAKAIIHNEPFKYVNLPVNLVSEFTDSLIYKSVINEWVKDFTE